MPHLSVQENVAFRLRGRRVPAGRIREQVAAGLTLVGAAVAAAGVVHASTFPEAAVEYEVTLAGGRPVRATAVRAKGQPLFPPGAEAMIAFDPADVTMIPQEDR